MIITFLIIIVLMFTISIGILIYSKDEYDCYKKIYDALDYLEMSQMELKSGKQYLMQNLIF